VSIVADSSQIAGESIGELIAIHNRVVVTVLLVVTHCLNHLSGHVGIHVVFSQRLTDRVNRLLSSCLVKLNVVKFRARWDRTNRESSDLWRRRTGELQSSVGLDMISAPANKKGELICGAVHN
jgi:hypothetical protein